MKGHTLPGPFQKKIWPPEEKFDIDVEIDKEKEKEKDEPYEPKCYLDKNGNKICPSVIEMNPFKK